MSDRYANSRRLFERAQRSIAAGVNSGIRKMEQPVPLYFQRGEGARVWDVDGNEYLDFQIGQGALLYGHAPAGMDAASWSASAPPDQWGDDENPAPSHPSAGVIPEVLEKFVVARWNDPAHLRRRVAEFSGRIAAIIF